MEQKSDMSEAGVLEGDASGQRPPCGAEPSGDADSIGWDEEWRARARQLAGELGSHKFERSTQAQLILAMALLPPLCGHLPCGKFDWSPPRMLVSITSAPLRVVFFSLLPQGEDEDRCEFCYLCPSESPFPAQQQGLFALRDSAFKHREAVLLPSDIVMLVDARIGFCDVVMRFMDETVPLKRPDQLSLDQNDFIPLSHVLKPLPDVTLEMVERALRGSEAPGSEAQQEARAAPPEAFPAEVAARKPKEQQRQGSSAEEAVAEASRRKRSMVHRRRKQRDSAEGEEGEDDGRGGGGEPAAAVRSADAVAAEPLADAVAAACPRAKAAPGRCHITLRPIGRRFSFRPLSAVTIHVQ